MSQNPVPPVNIPKAFKIDYLGRVFSSPKRYPFGFDPQPKNSAARVSEPNFSSAPTSLLPGAIAAKDTMRVGKLGANDAKEVTTSHLPEVASKQKSQEKSEKSEDLKKKLDFSMFNLWILWFCKWLGLKNECFFPRVFSLCPVLCHSVFSWQKCEDLS